MRIILDGRSRVQAYPVTKGESAAIGLSRGLEPCSQSTTCQSINADQQRFLNGWPFEYIKPVELHSINPDCTDPALRSWEDGKLASPTNCGGYDTKRERGLALSHYSDRGRTAGLGTADEWSVAESAGEPVACQYHFISADRRIPNGALALLPSPAADCARP